MLRPLRIRFQVQFELLCQDIQDQSPIFDGGRGGMERWLRQLALRASVGASRLG